jgi:catechol 2,3-dioxygenase-like lactoylglutathione lyase family enzyme
MKRFHVHLAVDDLEDNIRFYSAMFQAEPTVRQPDYAKWMLDDPRINFAISARGREPGLDHLGLQVESGDELEAVRQGLAAAALPVTAQDRAACCYAHSDKHWTVDPQGIAWEAFHTLESIPTFGADTVIRIEPRSTCCIGNCTDQASLKISPFEKVGLGGICGAGGYHGPPEIPPGPPFSKGGETPFRSREKGSHVA